VNGEPGPDHDQDREMTHSLFLAQQNANHRLEELEDQTMDESSSGEDYTSSTDSSLPIPASFSSADAASRNRRNRSSAMIDAIIYDTSPTSTAVEAKRTSVLLNECLFEGEHSFESIRRKTLWPLDRRQSLLLSDDLLRRWTERIDVAPGRAYDLHLKSSEKALLFEPNQESYFSPGSGPDSGTDVEIRERGERDQSTTAPAREEPTSDKSNVPFEMNEEPFDKLNSQTLSWFSIPNNGIFNSFRVGLEDPCYKVLPAALRKYNITGDWRQYALYIVYGDQERVVGLHEKPLALFKDLDRRGGKPMFMLRKTTTI
jgi:hypothetical protein